jgi:hypothetical protein
MNIGQLFRKPVMTEENMSARWEYPQNKVLRQTLEKSVLTSGTFLYAPHNADASGLPSGLTALLLPIT